MAKNKKWTDFNRDCHPERKPDEVFVANASESDGTYEKIGWETKRKGKTPYNLKGEPLNSSYPDLFPVFVKQSEIQEEDREILEDLMPTSVE